MATKSNLTASDVKGSETDIDLNIPEEIAIVDNFEKLQTDDQTQAIANKTSLSKNGFWSWKYVVLLSSFLSCFVVGVTYISFSIFYMYIVDHFDSYKANAGWIGSLYLATGNILGIVFSVFIKFYGCRMVAVIGGLAWCFGFALSAVAPNITFLYFSYGLVAGMGFNMVTLSSFVVVQQYFGKHRALAAGISAAGISVGTLSGGPIIGTLAAALGWRGALLILSGITLHCTLLGCFYRPIERTPKPIIVKDSRDLNKNDTKGEGLGNVFSQLCKDMTNLALFRNLAFALFCSGTFFMNIGLVIFYQHTPSRAVSLGMEKEVAARLPVAIGVATLVARIIGSFIGDLRFVNRTLQCGICLGLGGMLLLFNTLTLSFVTIALMGAAIGFLSGCALTVQTTVLSDIVGVENVARAQAFVLVATGFGALIAVPLAGFIYDRTLNYSIPFYTGGSSQMFGGILVIIAAIVKKSQSKNKE